MFLNVVNISNTLIRLRTVFFMEIGVTKSWAWVNANEYYPWDFKGKWHFRIGFRSYSWASDYGIFSFYNTNHLFISCVRNRKWVNVNGFNFKIHRLKCIDLFLYSSCCVGVQSSGSPGIYNFTKLQTLSIVNGKPQKKVPCILFLSIVRTTNSIDN